MGSLSAVRAIYLSICAVFILGLFLLFSRSFAELYRSLGAKLRLRELKRLMGEVPEGGELRGTAGLSSMVELAFGVKRENSGPLFIALSLGLALTVFVLLIFSYGAGLAIWGFIATALSPYLVLRTRLRNLQVDMSREGEQLLTELLNNYRIEGYNMGEAVERTALTIEDAPLSKRMLLDLSRQMNAASGEAELKKAIERFRLALSTSWGDLLAANLEFAAVDGIIVTESLRDLVENIGNARRLLEQTKRENSDSGMILKVLFPVMCALIYLGATAAFGLTPAQFARNQFATRTGMGWFISLVFSYLLSLLASAFIARRKMDI